MRVLVAISSCEQYERDGLNAPLRETWLPDLKKFGMDYKFFHGTGSTVKSDVIILNVDDGMGGLTDKLKSKCGWAIENSYDFIFSCFPDTYACVPRLSACGFQHFDYMGRVHQFTGSAEYCQGGPGYFLSRKACEVAYRATTSYLNDDCWLGDTLLSAGILPRDNRNFMYVGPGPLKGNQSTTNHLSTQPGGFTPAGMRAEHQRWIDSQ
jgi:hypothetical protein